MVSGRTIPSLCILALKVSLSFMPTGRHGSFRKKQTHRQRRILNSNLQIASIRTFQKVAIWKTNQNAVLIPFATTCKVAWSQDFQYEERLHSLGLNLLSECSEGANAGLLRQSHYFFQGFKLLQKTPFPNQPFYSGFEIHFFE